MSAASEVEQASPHAVTTVPGKNGSAIIRGEESLAAVAAAALRKKVEIYEFGSDYCKWTVEATMGAMADSRQTDMLV